MSGIEVNLPYTLTVGSPLSYEEVECSHEILICAEIPIPAPKPDVGEIINLKHDVLVENITRIPVKDSHDKYKFQNLLIRGLLLLSIEYSSDLPEQTVHVVHSHIPFDALIPQDNGCGLHQLSLQVKIDPIWMEKINSRLLENTTSLFFWFKRKNPINLQESEFKDCQHSIYSPKFASKQIAINQTVLLPPQQPKISRILDQIYSVDIIKAEVRSTPLLSHCCKKPIRKVVVKGKIEVLVKYETVFESQDVHAFTFVLPICVLVEWVGGPPLFSPICIEVISEHFQIDFLEENQLFCVSLLRLDIFRQNI